MLLQCLVLVAGVVASSKIDTAAQLKQSCVVVTGCSGWVGGHVADQVGGRCSYSHPSCTVDIAPQPVPLPPCSAAAIDPYMEGGASHTHLLATVRAVNTHAQYIYITFFTSLLTFKNIKNNAHLNARHNDPTCMHAVTG